MGLRMNVLKISCLKQFRLAWLAGLILSGATASAEPLSFKMCVNQALSQNPNMAVSSARIAYAKSALIKARSGRLPQVNLSLTIANSNNALTAFGMKLQQQSVVSSDFLPSSLNNPSAYTDFNTRVDVKLPVWNGGKVGFYEGQAKAMIQAVKQGDLAVQQYLVFQVYHAYEAIHAARAYIRVAEQAKRTAESFVKTTQNLVNEGVVVRSELLSAQTHLSMAEADLLEAKGQEVIALDRLKILMNKDVSAPLDVAERVNLKLPVNSAESLLALALEANPELAAKRKEVDASHYESRIAKADNFPHFNVMVRQEWNNDALSLDNGSYTVAGVVSWNALDFGATKSVVDMANAKTMQEKAAVLAQENRIRLDVLLNWQKMQVAQKQVQADRLSVAHATQAQALIIKRYEGGVATITEVLANKTQLDKAKADLVATEFDVNIYKAKLRLATGTMTVDQL